MSSTDTGKTCLIVSGGDCAEIENPAAGFDLIIACDKGYLNARKLNIAPDVIIGDFDSCSEETGDIPVVRLPVMKDDTDTLSAVKYALERGCSDITICCAFGGRFDHSLANIQTAAFIAAQGGRASLFGTDTCSYAFSRGSIILPKRPSFTLSVFSLSDRCENVSLSGTLYPLDDAILTSTFPIGVSNTWIADEAVISLGRGILLVVLSKDV